jgi:Proto-chlorophyllide reductase 57 kD subunit
MSANISWTTEAETKLKEIPFFVRPAARKKIEKFAQEQGNKEITVEIYEHRIFIRLRLIQIIVFGTANPTHS